MMIDLHLLTRISGGDYIFRNGICNKIATKVQHFMSDLSTDITNENYHAAYYRLSDFQSSSSSYCNLNFINFVSQMKFKLKTSNDNSDKREACEEVMLRMNSGIEDLYSRFPDAGLKVA